MVEALMATDNDAQTIADTIEATRCCSSCSTNLPLSAYYRHKQSAGGYLRQCKKCVLMTQAEKRKAKSPRLPFKERFESKFSVTPGCWVWTAGKHGDGYGQITVNGKTEKAHRLAYEIYVGPIAGGMHVCHKCDNPTCVNPDHLFLGTNAENMADRERKGRGIRLTGESHSMAKLTAAAVLQIRSDTRKQRDIAADFGVSQHTIWQVKHRKIWSHI